MNTTEIKNVLEAALLCSAEPLSMVQLRKLFDDEFNAELLRPLLDELALDWADRSVELVAVASGWRFQSKPRYALFINRLSPEKAPRYSRAVMETLAIIAYRQPVTRGDIEEIRGVSVGSQIVKTLEDRGWIDVIGHKEVAGRPALFGTTRQFLDDLNLLSIKELPPIDEMGGEESADFFGAQAVEALTPESEALPDGALESETEDTGALPPESDSGAALVAENDSAEPEEAANDQDGAATEADSDPLTVSNDPVAAEIDRIDDSVQAPTQAVEPTEPVEPEPVVAAAEPVESEANLESEARLESELSESDKGVPDTAADGVFLAAATAEAVSALSDVEDVTELASTHPEVAPSEVAPSIGSEVAGTESAAVSTRPVTPNVTRQSGSAIDDPNLEQVDWPDLPSLDGLDDSAQESSEQDPPNGESEPVESR